MEISLGTRLLLLRRESGLRQEDLAEASGVSQSYIANIERGKVTNVGVDYIFALARGLDVRVEHLLGLSDVVVDEDDFSHLGQPPGLYGVRLSEEEEEALLLLRSMSAGDREQAMGVLRRLGRTPQLVELDELLRALTKEIGVERLSVVLGQLMDGSVGGPGDE